MHAVSVIIGPLTIIITSQHVMTARGAAWVRGPHSSRAPQGVQTCLRAAEMYSRLRQRYDGTCMALWAHAAARTSMANHNPAHDGATGPRLSRCGRHARAFPQGTRTTDIVALWAAPPATQLLWGPRDQAAAQRGYSCTCRTIAESACM